MKHTKREWMPLYSFLDRKRVTDHLADMAARGWMLDRLGTGPGTTGGQSRSSSGSPSPFSPGPGGSLPLRRRGDQNAGKILELCRCDRLHLRDWAVGGDFNQAGRAARIRFS